MVRLVFRPYTQVRRSICTLESLRTSTRVSPGFALLRHSSPSFGSQHVCSHSNLSSKESWSVDSAAEASYLNEQKLIFTFITRWGVDPEHSHTCQTPWSVFQDGLMRAISSESLNRTTASRHHTGDKASLAQTRKPDSFADTSDYETTLTPIGSISAISGTFNSLFKVLFIFPSRYLFAIGLPPIFSFRWNLPPTQSCNPKQLDSLKTGRTLVYSRHERGCHPPRRSFPEDFAHR